MTLGELESIVGSRYVSNSPLEIYANTLSFSSDQEVYVVRPGSAREVSEVVKLANERGMRVIPRGMGTRSSASPFSHVVNGILMDMTRMRRVRGVDLGTMTVIVEAGITISKLNTTPAPRGYSKYKERCRENLRKRIDMAQRDAMKKWNDARLLLIYTQPIYTYVDYNDRVITKLNSLMFSELFKKPDSG